ncbi:unnamed protein product [Meganyctiphanes norvegica]|uniref:WAP domain-containing protein n=1 Tax=Meganyctiphanes norvegica TaxID=48144 RepID=A0AAV2QQD4_MEGNR
MARLLLVCLALVSAASAQTAAPAASSSASGGSDGSNSSADIQGFGQQGFHQQGSPQQRFRRQAAVTKPGQCPAVRPSCPPTRFGQPPKPCSSDGGCVGVDKCCFDVCLQHHTCKPPIGRR